MVDLIEKFFQGELTEAEDETLAGLLNSSEEAAGRFAEAAKAAYISFGLPEPGLLENITRLFRMYWGRYLTVAVAVGGLTTLYLLSEKGRNSKPETVPLPAPAAVTAPAPVRQAPMLVPQRVKPPVEKQETPLRIPVPTTPLAGPPEPGEEGAKDYRNLKVVVQQDEGGPVLVRILGQDGLEVRRLYDGPLGAGQWSFTWDGILGDGRPAAPGRYQIEIKAGSALKTQEVVIRSKTGR
jgi:hypothetical protein